MPLYIVLGSYSAVCGSTWLIPELFLHTEHSLALPLTCNYTQRLWLLLRSRLPVQGSLSF